MTREEEILEAIDILISECDDNFRFYADCAFIDTKIPSSQETEEAFAAGANWFRNLIQKEMDKL